MKSSASKRPLPTAAENLVQKLLAFRKTVWFRVGYLVLLGVVVWALFGVLVLSPSTQCLAVLLIPIVIFVFPYWLGERSTKNFLVNFVPIFLIAVLLVAANQTRVSTDPTAISLESATTDSTNLTIHYGNVTPFAAAGPVEVNFTVEVASTTVNLSRVNVAVNLTPYDNLAVGATQTYPMTPDLSKNNTNASQWYYRSVTVGPSVWLLNFYANDTSGNHIETGLLLAPITAPWQNYYVLWVYVTSVNLLIPFSFYFVIIFMLWYTNRMRQMRSRMVEAAAKKKAGPEGQAEKTAEAGTQGTAGKKPAGFTCTNCGADVNEDDAKCPKCGAVFED